MAKSLPSYIRDSADLLNKIKNLQVSARAILASLDVVSLYTNIPHKEGISSVHKATLESESPRVEAATLAELTKIVRKNNVLELRYGHGNQTSAGLRQCVHAGCQELLANASPPRQDRHMVSLH